MTDTHTTRTAAAGTTGSARQILPHLAALAADPYIPEVHGDEDDTDTTPLDLDAIATRAAHLAEYTDLPADADLLAGQDVPALIAAVRQFRAELSKADRLWRERETENGKLFDKLMAAENERDQFRAERDAYADRVDTLTAVAQSNKRHVVALYADLQEVQRERDALQQRLDAVLALCDQEQRNATRWEQPLPVPEWVAAVRNAASPAGAEDGDRRA